MHGANHRQTELRDDLAESIPEPMTRPTLPLARPGLHPVGILGIGAHVPERILTNQDLTEMVDTSNEWIVTRTGMRERRLAAPGEATSDLAAKAAKLAL